MARANRQLLNNKTRQLSAMARALDSISPLATLQRGYAIVQRLPDHAVIRDTSQIKPGDRIQARLAKGLLFCTVDKVHKD